MEYINLYFVSHVYIHLYFWKYFIESLSHHQTIGRILNPHYNVCLCWLGFEVNVALARYFSHIATWKQEITNPWNHSDETGNRTPAAYSANRKLNHYTTAAYALRHCSLLICWLIGLRQQLYNGCTWNLYAQWLFYTGTFMTPGFKSRIRPPYPQRVVKGD